MRTKRRFILAATLLALLVAGGFIWLMVALAGPRNPVYEGHPLSYWVNQPRANPMCYWTGIVQTGPGGYLRKLDRIRGPKIDSNAVPFLVESLHRQDGTLQKWYTQAWNEFAPKYAWWRTNLPAPVPAATAHFNAAVMLAEISPASPETIEALAKASLQDQGETAELEIEVVAKVGGQNPAAIKHLMLIAGCPDISKRKVALGELSASVGINREVTEMYFQLSRDTSNPAADMASAVLSGSVKRLAKNALTNRDDPTRLMVMQDLVRIGQPAFLQDRGPLNDITDVAMGESNAEPVRLAALVALSEIGTKWPPVWWKLPTLIRGANGSLKNGVLKDAAVDTLQHCIPQMLADAYEAAPNGDAIPSIQTLGLVGGQNNQVVQTLVNVTRTSSNSAARRNVSYALSEMGEPSLAVDGWTELVSNPEYADDAYRGLGSIQTHRRKRQAVAMQALEKGSTNRSIPVLIRILSDDPNPDRRLGAVGLLGRMGSSNADAIAAMVKVAGIDVVDDTNLALRLASLDALENIDVGDANSTMALNRIAEHDSHASVRAGAKQALAKTSSEKIISIRSLAQTLQASTDEVEQKRAADSLGELGNQNEEAIQALLKAMEAGTNFNVHRAAVQALVKIGVQNPVAIRELARMVLTSTDGFLHQFVVNGLGAIGEGSDTAIQALAELSLKETAGARRLIAMRLLVKIGGKNRVVIETLKTMKENDTFERARTEAESLLNQLEASGPAQPVEPAH